MIEELNKLKVNTGQQPYYIYFQDSFNSLNYLLKEYEYDRNVKIGIITDSTVDTLYTKELIDSLSDFKNIHTFSFEAGEENKTFQTVLKGYDFLIDNKFDRKSLLIALGGGVVGDLTGYIAATFMRGVDYIQVPTTLLAQVDSSVGGKTGFDYRGYKNMIGAFNQPKFVYMNLKTLNTLPSEEFNAGMAEAIKHGYIMDSNYLEYMKMHKEDIKNLEYKTMVELVQGSCRIKAYVVSQDEKELGLREILNFGHTIGHAVESLCKFTKLHGECVSLGMVSALYMSYKLNNITEKELNEGLELLQYFSLPTKISSVNTDDVYDTLFLDKKTKHGIIKFVLLDKIGHAINNVELDKEIIKESIEYIKQ